MQITELKLVEKNKWLVSFEDSFTFPLYRQDLRHYRLEEGAEIKEEIFLDIRNEVVLRRAKKKAITCLERMDRTELEVRNKLSEADYPSDVIEDAIAWLYSFHYLDDSRYAKHYISRRFLVKSKKELQLQLHRKGISKELFEEAMEECIDEQQTLNGEEEFITPELAAIKRFVDRKCKNVSEISELEQKKIVQSLIRKGFHISDIQKILHIPEY